LKNLPERYHPLVRSALDEYESGKEAGYDSAISREYAAYILGQVASEHKKERAENGLQSENL